VLPFKLDVTFWQFIESQNNDKYSADPAPTCR